MTIEPSPPPKVPGPVLNDKLKDVTTRELIVELHGRMFYSEHNSHIVWYMEGCCTEALEHMPLNILEYPNDIDHEDYPITEVKKP